MIGNRQKNRKKWNFRFIDLMMIVKEAFYIIFVVHLVVFICVLFCFPSFLFSVNPLFQLYDPTQIYTKANTTFFARRNKKQKKWCAVRACVVVPKNKKGKKIDFTNTKYRHKLIMLPGNLQNFKNLIGKLTAIHAFTL